MRKKPKKPNYFIIEVPYAQQYEVLAKNKEQALNKLTKVLDKVHHNHEVSLCGLRSGGAPKVINSWWVSGTEI